MRAAAPWYATFYGVRGLLRLLAGSFIVWNGILFFGFVSREPGSLAAKILSALLGTYRLWPSTLIFVPFAALMLWNAVYWPAFGVENEPHDWWGRPK
jgi:hypothetical protein